MKADFSTIIGGFFVFTIFIISLFMLYYIVTLNSEKALIILDRDLENLYRRHLEIVDFLNNETDSNNPILIIKNIGKVSLDLSCFKIYVNGNLTNFSYSIEDLYKDFLLNPGETANITLSSDNIGWKKIIMVSCNGNKFETLIYYR